MKSSRALTAAALVFIFLTVVFQCSTRSGEVNQKQDGKGVLSQSTRSTRPNKTSRRGVTRSDRNGEAKIPNAHVIDLHSDESVLFVARNVGEYDGILVHLGTMRFTDEDGLEQIRVIPKLVDISKAIWDDFDDRGSLLEEPGDRILKEGDRDPIFRDLSRTRGIDIMTFFSQPVGLESTIEILLCPGLEQALLVEARLQEGDDGKMKLQFGEPYIRAREDAAEIIERFDPAPGTDGK